MSRFLADAISARIDNGAQLFESDRALLAAIDYCERIRGGAATYPDDIADEIERVIARELDINPEEIS
jgi:hypothetical protein